MTATPAASGEPGQPEKLHSTTTEFFWIGAPLTLRFANVSDVLDIHRFTCVHGIKIALAPIDPEKSLREIFRVVTDECGLIAEIDGEIVGTMGLMRTGWWFSHDSFLTDRWFFVSPQHKNSGVGKALIAEANEIAEQSGLLFLINPKYRPKRA